MHLPWEYVAEEGTGGGGERGQGNHEQDCLMGYIFVGESSAG